ncbi:MAG: outer membrane protein assembly factor BamA [bacterium]
MKKQTVNNSMKNSVIRASLAGCLLVAYQSSSAASFIVKDIEVDGLERVAAGTVLSNIPANVGESFDDQQSSTILRALYQTGLFDDVKISRRGDVLVVKVVERPAIGEINISGNNVFKKDQLLEVLRKANIAQGHTMDRSSLARIQREIKEQYLAQGRYGTQVETTVDNLPRNRVAINIKIRESKSSRIQNVRIIGARAFSEKQLLKLMNSGTKSSYAFWSSRDQYERRKLAADLDKLSAHYRDRGYLNFEVVSTQVSLTPDKKSTYLTINIKEGDQYKVANIDVVGNLGLDQQAVKKMVALKTGDYFSQKKLEETRKNFATKLGEKGYAFSKVQVASDINEVSKQVAIRFVVDPGKRTYVRRINIKGNFRTKDEVYRREMRQLESSWYSREQVERSKVRIQRLPYVESVAINQSPVAGRPDQVDLDVTVTERLSNEFSVGAGYSQNQGILFNVSLKQENFMGSGKRLFVNAARSAAVNDLRVTYTNPYYTADGISRGFTAYYRETKAKENLVSDYISDRVGGDVHYTIPLSETDSFRFSVGGEQRTITQGDESPDHITEFLDKHGNEYTQILGSVGYVRDTRDRTIFPTKGQKHSLKLDSALPGSDLEYNKLTYNGSFYMPVTNEIIFSAKGRVGVGKGSGDLENLPFFDRYYAGGIRSVRGFKQNSLGPKDTEGKSQGGDFVTSASAELIFPAPFMSDAKSFRMSTFVDAGNVFADQDDFDAEEIRYSAGVGAIWLSPLGPFTLSYAKPLNKKDSDEDQVIQFSLGTTF